MKGTCRICGEIKKLTFEHVPPQSAFNSSPIYLQKSIHLHKKDNHLFGKRIRSNQGAGGYYLCKTCNNNTGSWYSKSYRNLAYMGTAALCYRVHASKYISFEYAIQPLNVLKQVLSMFMAIDTSDNLLDLDGLKAFILNKKSQDLPNGLRVYMYHTTSKSIRNGWAMVLSNGNPCFMGEITFAPFGFIYTLDSEPVRKDFFEITNFSNYHFNQTIQARLTMPFIMPKSYIPSFY